MSKKKKIILPILIVLVIVWIGVYRSGALRKDENEAVGEEIIPKVGIEIISKRDEVKVPIFLSGKIKPKKYTLVKSMANGFLQGIMPIGNEVRAGQELFRIYDEGVEANYYNALAGLMTAQQNLREVEAVSEESVKQAELGVKNARAGLSFARANLENTRKSTDQAIKTAEDSGRAAYDSAFNAVDQILRFVGGGDMEEYVFRNMRSYNFQGKIDVKNQFDVVTRLYGDRNLRIAPEGNNFDIKKDLEEMDKLLEETRRLADLTLLDLSYAVITRDVSQTLIDGYKAQLSGMFISLNASNASVRGLQNGIKSAKLAQDFAVEAAEIQVEQAENGLENAKAALELAKSGIETRKLGAQAQLNGAQAQFDMAKYQYDNLIAGAKFSGTVISNLVEIGDQVNIGVPVLELGDVRMIEIELEVGTREARQLSVGSDANISLGVARDRQIHANDINDDVVVGKITEIEPAALGASGKVKIKVEADNKDYQFVPGEVAEVQIELVYVGEDLVVIPLSSVVVGQNESYVFLVEADINADGDAEGDAEGLMVAKKVVETGAVYGSMVEIVSGLDVGDKVVIYGGGFLGEGDVVEIAGD